MRTPLEAQTGVTALLFVTEHRDQQYERDIEAGDGRRKSRALEAEARRTPIAIHQEPVAREVEVEEVGADHREGDRPDDVPGLQVAAEDRVEEQGRHTPKQGVDEGAEQLHDPWVGTDSAKQGNGERKQQRDDRRNAQRNPKPLDQSAAAGSIVPRAEGLRDQRIHAGQHACAADNDGVEEHAAETAGSDRGGAQSPRHDGIDEAHRHPAEFGHGKRRGQAQHRTDLFSKACDHALGCALS